MKRTQGHSKLFLLLLTGVFLFSGCGVEVLHRLPEPEANDVLAVLQKNGIVAQKSLDDAEQNTWTVSVSRQATTRAWALLDEYKLPKTKERRFQDVFGQSKLVVTPMEERALFLEALQGELAETLEAISGVIDARVHLVLPQADLTGQMMSAAKASVVLEYQPNVLGKSPIAEDEIQALVAHAVEGLRSSSVAVVLKPTSTAAPADQGSFDLVTSAGLVLEQGSLPRFKLYVAVTVLLMIALGALIVFSGRTNNRLRDQLEAATRQLRAARRGRAPLQKVGAELAEG